MSGSKFKIDSSSSLSDLIRIAEQDRWCTRPVCTTCGAHPFRNALREIPRDKVIAGLRILSRDFLSKHKDMFRLVISEVSFFDVSGELLDTLERTPAGEQLRANVDYQHSEHERRKAHLATQTPEAIAERRAKGKAAKEQSTAPHRERKLASESGIRATALELDATPVAHILELVARKDFDVPLQAVGGLIYKRLKEHYEANQIQSEDLRALSQLPERRSGYCKQLFGRIA